MLKEKGYKQVSLPEELIEKIKVVINNNKGTGYKTVPEFIKDAIREKILQLENETENLISNKIPKITGGEKILFTSYNVHHDLTEAFVFLPTVIENGYWQFYVFDDYDSGSIDGYAQIQVIINSFVNEFKLSEGTFCFNQFGVKWYGTGLNSFYFNLQQINDRYNSVSDEIKKQFHDSEQGFYL